jgi:hypothetical protein
VRFLLGTACLTGATAAYGMQDASFVPWQGDLWFPEYSVDPQGRPDATGKHVGWLGEAVGSWSKLANGMHVRFFQHGVVLVNPTGGALSVDLLYPRWKRIGSVNPERVVTVGPTDALFLWGE